MCPGPTDDEDSADDASGDDYENFDSDSASEQGNLPGEDGYGS